MTELTGTKCNGLPSPDCGFFQPRGCVVPFMPCPKDWLVDFPAAELVSKKNPKNS